jgi:murein L,D-transpeptidase YcbB/YkuD
MVVRALIAALAGASALTIAGGSFAAAPTERPLIELAPIGQVVPTKKPAPSAKIIRVAKIAPAAKTAKPADASVTPAAADYPIYDSIVDPMTAAIRGALAGAGTQGAFLDKRDAAGVAEYYAEQGYAPVWTADGKLTERALGIIARIKNAAVDGLDPAAYPLPPVQLGQAMPATIEAVAGADVALSDAIVTYARHAHSGRLDPSAVSPNFDYPAHLVDPLEVLGKLVTTGDTDAVLSSYNPQHPEFQKLLAQLALIRNTPVITSIVVPDGPSLKPGMTDPRVAILRQRLKIADPAVDPNLYDPAVVVAVKAWQGSAGLKADGMIGKNALAVLNKPPANPVSTIIANMERWRWMPEDLGPFYVRVNIPNFNLDIYRNGTVIHTTRIVVGQTDKQTPIFSNEIQTVDVNPTWNVPASIAVKEMLPKLLSNPASMAGYQVFVNYNGHFQVVDPTSVDWQSVDMKRVQIKQPPGDDNALGSIKFLFPNPYAVYLHDTPSKSFFQRDYRALSHGCMRVQNPWDFAAVLLQGEPNVTVSALKAMVGGPEQQVQLAHRVPVHITYFTAWVDDSGALQLRNDVYGHDRRMEQMLGLS